MASTHAGAGAMAHPFLPLIRKVAPLAVLVLLCIGFGLASENFLSLGNLTRILSSAAIPAVLAIGVSFVILTGGIDLSVEGVIAVAAVLLASVIGDQAGIGASLAGAAAAILAGAAVGLFSGTVHVALKIPSFMVTLGAWFIGIGAATLISGGGTLAIRASSLRSLALTRLAGLPLSVWIAVLAVLLAVIIQRRTRLGRRIYAIGGGEDLAALSGIPVRRTKIMVFMLAGAFYGLGAVLAAAQLGQGNADLGQGRLFMTITAVVVGGTSLLGGHGNVLNVMIGVLVVAVLANGMILLGIPPYLQQGVQGVLIIAAVALSLDRAGLRVVK
ncbi:ABC transporter permease [Aureimonas frigidaquae]|uniref:Permease component of ribose/xylose/arabinose/galactoside ABC-type transporters n=1 Tax=Aureimonas frigidaquae TaxID=424757 RepID=A0A0P0Z2G6_9HYPH|nr:ABC transporter permease [Aureimonas frigidaquae]BAT28189.1 permease component of ribose/xylose/arabinose/galactoside ABC-type transporters precursor [Aureimonas frigidaquae]